MDIEALEQQVIAHLAGVVSGAQIFGTFDTSELVGESAPRLAVQVEYQGFDTLENRPQAVSLAPTFAVHFIVDAARARATERAAAQAGQAAAIKRLLAWPDTRLRAEIRASPAQPFDGRTVRLSVFFTLAPVLVTAD